MAPYWTDLFLAADVPDSLLVMAMAGAFEVHVGAVGVSPEETEDGMRIWRRPETEILIQRMRDEQPGEFPVGLMISLKADTVRDPISKVCAFARHLETAIITDIETPAHTDTQWRLVAPDGWSGIVTVDFDAFNPHAFVLAPEAQALLDAHTPRSPVRHAS